MGATIVNRQSRATKSRLRPVRGPSPAAVAVAPEAKHSDVGAEAAELPSRAALTARLEEQRRELLRAMACVGRARRILEQHAAKRPLGEVLPLPSRRRERYEQRALEALSDASQALTTAYPMLQRIADALDVEEMLKEHAPERPGAPVPRRSAAPKQ